MLEGPPITPGSGGSLKCPYVAKIWHKLAARDILLQSQTLHLKQLERELVRKEQMTEMWICEQCGYKRNPDSDSDAPDCVIGTKHFTGHKYCRESEYEKTTIETAKRDSHPTRYDILNPVFLEMMAMIADYGAKKYGDFNWQRSRLEGDKGSVNHMYNHLKCYRNGENYDHIELGESKTWHLAAIAFNAMMEYHWAIKTEKSQDQTALEKTGNPGTKRNG